MGGIADDRVEIDHRVERATGTNELIDRFALRFAGRGEVAWEGGPLEWRQCRAIYPETARVGARDQLPIAVDDVVGAHQLLRSAQCAGKPQVVDAFQQGDELAKD